MILLNNAKKNKIIIVVSEFNSRIIERLLYGAKSAFYYYGGIDGNLKVYKVPGAFEIPGTVNLLLQNSKSDVIIALGAIIRGETPHFDYIAKESAHGLAQLARRADIPIINGILTTDNIKQAMNRTNSSNTNKGWVAIEAALQMISVYNEIKTFS